MMRQTEAERAVEGADSSTFQAVYDRMSGEVTLAQQRVQIESPVPFRTLLTHRLTVLQTGGKI